MKTRFGRRRLLRGALAVGAGLSAWGAGACAPISGPRPSVQQVFQRQIDRLLHRYTPGEDVVLTIDQKLQQAADTLMGDASGAIVGIEPATGLVLILLSKPSFDPNGLVLNPNAPSGQAEHKRIQDYWQGLLSDPGKPLINRATSGLYVPGSTFKTVTLAAALDRRIVTPDQMFRFTLKPPSSGHSVLWHENAWTSCQNHPQFAQLDLAGCYAWSCNVVFSELGVKLGPEVYTDYAKRFGLEDAIPFELETAPSRLTSTPNYFGGSEGTYGLASTAFGQGQLQVTPLQMALVAATMANGGVLMRPRLVAETRRGDGSAISRTDAERWRQPVAPESATLVARMMVGGVENGWASAVKTAGLTLGGKTGTAELQAGVIPHSWFIGFGTAEAPRIALAVIVENAGFGSDRAAPIAKQLLQLALK